MRARFRTLWFPLAVLFVVGVMGVAQINGSSVAFYAASDRDDGLLAGTPNYVRSDEYWVRTPLVVRSVEKGFPDRDQIGVGEHDLGVVSQLPTDGLGLVLRPYTIPYHVVGLDTAFALEWWILLLALPVLGVYVFLLALGVRLWIAIPASLLVFSPAILWWTAPITGTTIGFAALAGAALIAATRTTSMWKRVALAALGGWMGACLVAGLYPPWIVAIGLVVAAASVAAIVRAMPEDRRAWLLRLAVVAVVAVGVAGVLLLAFFLEHREAIRAVTDSVYPGRRRSSGGSGPGRFLFVAPFDILQSARSSPLVVVNGESGLEPAGLPLLLVVTAAVLAGRPKAIVAPWRRQIVLLSILATGAVLLAWYLLPVPKLVGGLIALTWIPPIRLTLPLALAGVVAFAVYVERRRDDPEPTSWWRVAAGVIVFVVGSVWAGRWLVIDGSHPPAWQYLGLIALFAIGIGIALRGRPAGVVVLAVLLGVSALFVNPWQRGLEPLTNSPAARLGRELQARPEVGAVLMLSDDPGIRVIRARGGLTASGVPLISGVNLYPDVDAWRRLDPVPRDEFVWNRYNNASWGAADPGSVARTHLDSKDSVIVIVDPCDPQLRELGVTTVVTLKALDRPCLRLTDVVHDDPEHAMRVYQITR